MVSRRGAAAAWLSIGSMADLTTSLKELERLVCPVCHHKLRAGEQAVVCMGCLRSYPVEDGIPVLLAARAG